MKRLVFVVFFLIPFITLASDTRDIENELKLTLEKLIASNKVLCKTRPDCACEKYDSNSKNLTLAYSVSRLCPEIIDGEIAVRLETFDDRGNLVDSCPTVDGFFHGKCKGYYSNGKLRAETRFVKGCHFGREKTWYSSGNIEWDTNYSNGEPDGKWTRYLENGDVESITFWKNGKPTHGERRDENGKLVHWKPSTSARKSTDKWKCLGKVINIADEE